MTTRDKDKMNRLFYETLKGRISQETRDWVTAEAETAGVHPGTMAMQLLGEYRVSKEYKKDFHRWNKDRLRKKIEDRKNR